MAKPGPLEKATGTIVWPGGEQTLHEYGRGGGAAYRLAQKAVRMCATLTNVSVVRAIHGQCFACDRILPEHDLGVFASIGDTTNLICVACSDEAGGWVNDYDFPSMHEPCATKGCEGTWNARELNDSGLCPWCEQWAGLDDGVK